VTTEPSSKKRGVFLIDDHPLVREWLTNLINHQPDLAVCGEAATAAEARQRLGSLKVDVAVVDIALRDASGIDLIKDLKKACPKLAVLILSMYDESLYAERALLAGAKGYITKRESTQKVVEGIRSVLQGRLFLSEAMMQAIVAQYVEGKTLASRSPLEQLSDREFAVFDMLGEGLGTRQISQRLGLSIKTVQAYCARAKDKLGLQSGTDLLREAFRHREANAASAALDQPEPVCPPSNPQAGENNGAGNHTAEE
jgi:DNA-binding NarL/FixJ family response regulator